MRLLGAGDNVVDRYVTHGKVYPGGNAVNVAVFASRLGADAAYLGILGDDTAGQLVLSSLRSEGVNTDLTIVAAGANAYANVRLVDHERVFAGSHRGVAMFDPTDAQLDAMAAFDVVHTSYSGSLAPHVAQMAKRTSVSFDFGVRFTREDAWPMLPQLFLASFSGSDLAEPEARDLATDAVAGGAKYALVTRGGDGAFLASPAGLLFQEADQVVVRDTLGAGDAFIASLLVGVLSRRNLTEVLASASAHAAQVCMDYGAFGHGVDAKVDVGANATVEQIMVETGQHHGSSTDKAVIK